MSAKVCVVGSFMFDLVAEAPRRPQPGETLVGTSFATYPGGKGYNQAIAAARAGARTSLVGRLGEDAFGQEFRQALARERVDASQVIFDVSEGTGVGLPIVEPDGQNSIVIVPRANLRVDVAQIRSASAAITEADVLLLQLELPVESVVAAAAIARQAGTMVVLNPAPFTPMPLELLRLVDLVVPNEVELDDLTGQGSHSHLPFADRAEWLRDEWEVDLAVTLGSRGVLVLTRDGARHRIPAHPVRAIDTVGAGDTFCGYLGAQLAAGLALPEAARVANAAGALAVTRQGGAAAVPMKADVDALLAEPHRAGAEGSAAYVLAERRLP